MRLQKKRIERAQLLLKELKKLFPKDKHEISELTHWSNPWELLVAVVLSAQCTDKRVNMVTKDLFKKYITLDDYCAVSHEEFAQDIHSTGFYNSKTKNILAAAQMVRDEYDGKVPDIMSALIRIPGVARKTANVVLGNAFGKVEGMAVDTHVKRFAIRFDLTDEKNPEKIERDLMELLPRKDWFIGSNLMIQYGRHIAPARKYDTSKDPLVDIYPKAGERFRVN
jgi:endonuclease-3